MIYVTCRTPTGRQFRWTASRYWGRFDSVHGLRAKYGLVCCRCWVRRQQCEGEYALRTTLPRRPLRSRKKPR